MRMSGLSIPIPNAIVATITSIVAGRELLLNPLAVFGIEAGVIRGSWEMHVELARQRSACLRVGA